MYIDLYACFVGFGLFKGRLRQFSPFEVMGKVGSKVLQEICADGLQSQVIGCVPQPAICQQQFSYLS